jgi:hypothetical protein
VPPDLLPRRTGNNEGGREGDVSEGLMTARRRLCVLVHLPEDAVGEVFLFGVASLLTAASQSKACQEAQELRWMSSSRQLRREIEICQSKTRTG